MVGRVSFCQLSSRRGTQKFTVNGRELLLLTSFDEIFDQFAFRRCPQGELDRFSVSPKTN